MAKSGTIFLNLIKTISEKKKQDIISCLGCPDEVLKATESSLRKIASFSDSDIRAIIEARTSGVLDSELNAVKNAGVEVIDIYDDSYPELLKEISHPPLVLYVKGNVDVLSKRCFAIVGSRNATDYGISMAQRFGAELANLGIVVVSGLARGIDSAAHRAALKSGITVAVTGSGLNRVYPRENTELASAISKQGAVISEYPMSEPPLRENFPRRNRIISGLSKGILVVEAALRSGALITARHGCEQNRDIFAIPGNVDSEGSKGTHALIKEGAKLVESIEDIVQELPFEFISQEEETASSC